MYIYVNQIHMFIIQACTLYLHVMLILWFYSCNAVCYHSQQTDIIIGENEDATSKPMTVNENNLLGDCVEVTNES